VTHSMEIKKDNYTFYVDVDYRKGYQGVYHLLPEDCYESCDDELDVVITAIEEEFDSGTYLLYSSTHMPEQFDELCDEYIGSVVESVWEIIEENKYG
jgi:hypothetical protein